MTRAILLFIALLAATSCGAQTTVRQSGTVTPGHATKWITNGVIGDGGTAANGGLTSLGVTAQGPGICQNSGPITGPYNRLCLSVSTASTAQIVLQANNGAQEQSLELVVNGVVIPIPQSPPGSVSTRMVTGTGAITVGASDGAILVNKTVPAATSIVLPVAATRDGNPITIKDYSQTSTTYNLTFVPNGAETIDGLGSWIIASNGALTTLYPLPAGGGWWVGP